MPPRSAKKPAPLPSMFKAVAEKRSNELHQDFDFDLVEKPAKKQARMPPPPPLVEEPRGAAFVRLDGIK